MRLDFVVATHYWHGWGECVNSWMDTATYGHSYLIVGEKEVLPAFQHGYENTLGPILAYVHDDVVFYEEGWDERVLREFEDPSVGVVGFGGAIGHGRPDLYTVPYHLPNLARQNFLSNMRSAEKHGVRFTGERDVAILDGFSLFVRRSILDKVGGWPIGKPVGYFMYSEWLCCEARRQGYRIRLVGVDCEHLGGKSSGHIPKSPSYEEEHAYFYETNRDMMPYRISDENLSDNAAERVPSRSTRIRFPGNSEGGGRA